MHVCCEVCPNTWEKYCLCLKELVVGHSSSSCMPCFADAKGSKIEGFNVESIFKLTLLNHMNTGLLTSECSLTYISLGAHTVSQGESVSKQFYSHLFNKDSFENLSSAKRKTLCPLFPIHSHRPNKKPQNQQYFLLSKQQPKKNNNNTFQELIIIP